MGAETGVRVYGGRLNASGLDVFHCDTGLDRSAHAQVAVRGAVVLNNWANVVGITDYSEYMPEETHTQLLPPQYSGVYQLLFLGLTSWGLGTALLEWALKMHFLHARRAKQGCFGAAILLAAGLGLALWAVAAMTAVQFGIDSLSVTHFYDSFSFWWGNIAKPLMIFCGFIALVTLGYLYMAVGRRIKDFRAMAELREAEKLMKQKDRRLM